MNDPLYRGTVLEHTHLTPGMIRIVFGGEGLRAFESTGVGDEYLRLHFPFPDTGEPALPDVNPGGSRGEAGPGADEADRYAQTRRYTVRRFDAERGEVTIDFVVHDGGVASAWALAARPGDQVGIGTPRGLYAPPAETVWQILACDAAGLPALGRLVEQLPARTRARVIVEVADAGHEQVFDSAADVEYVWLHGSGNGAAPSRLAQALRAMTLPEGPGYVWAAGETRALREIRRHVRHELGLHARMYKVIGYWTHNAEEWDERYAGLDPEVKRRLETAFDAVHEEQPEEEIENILDEVEATLEGVGL
ncbi:siderophore-interacting protein [Embleya sp. NPDC005971]|uniref:siderophore-interacting protein n=1 Tax=Embleya sp. NPDC005971 TaxID=3156724 RepID=UPI0033D4D3CA